MTAVTISGTDATTHSTLRPDDMAVDLLVGRLGARVQAQAEVGPWRVCLCPCSLCFAPVEVPDE